ncbi:MAG: recombinase family protein [Candidatus Omnitrophota bacterium]|jgi:DNA invertase Pin-like site-specific DNA recombinase
MKVALYARVSTIESDKTYLANGEEHAKQDPETQLRKLRRYAQAMDWEIIGEYVDRASGADPNRPRLAELMKKARLHELDIILCVRLDRITRSLANLLTTIEDLDRWKIRLVCTDQNIETGSATGRLMVQLLGALAEFERELTIERIHDGMERAKAAGVHVGRPRVDINWSEYDRLKTEGISNRKIAGFLRVSEATLRGCVKRRGLSPLNTKGGKKCLRE